MHDTVTESAVEPTVEPTAKITKFTADEWREAYGDNPRERIRLCKTFSPDEETGQLKKGDPGKIASGSYATFDISLRQLKDGLAKLTEQQAIGLGTAEQVKGRIGFKHREGEIRRTKSNFCFRDQPTFFLIDVDGIHLSQGEIIEIISGIVPGFAEAGKLIVPSSSAGLYSADGKLLKDSSSLHIYFIINEGTDASRFMKALFDRLWLVGHGFYQISKAPSLLQRAIIDQAVVGDERVIYEAKPRLLGAITQKRPDPLLIEGGMVDTRLTLDLNAAEKETLEGIRQEKKEEIQPELEEARSAKVDRIVKERNVTREDAERIVGENQRGRIDDSDKLFFAGLPPVLAGEVLDNLKEYHKRTCGEPMEPDYDGGNRTKAQFYANLDKPGGQPIIYSQAHGGIVYRFSRYEKKTAEPSINTPQETVEFFGKAFRNGSVSRFIDHEPPDLEWIFKGTLLARTTGLLVGPGAAGKSTLALLMLIAVATGRDILPGIFTPTRAGKVMGVFAEDDETIIHHRLHNMVEILFCNDIEAKDLLRKNMKVVTTTGHDVRFFTQSGGDLQESSFFTEVLEAIKNVDDLRLIILDPVSRYHGSEENDNGAGTFLVSLMERIAQQTGAAVLCLHHVGKRAGSDVHGFDLAAAMHQDASRGASGLTNGVRWQCNLFGIPENRTQKILSKASDPGQYLALKVSKKNYGAPEPTHFLERLKDGGGMLMPFYPPIKELDQDLEEKIRSLVLDAVTRHEDKRFTIRTLMEGHQKTWKKEDSRITATAIKETIATCIVNGELFERIGKNASGRKITYLSHYEDTSRKTEPETDFEPEIEVEIEVEKFKPEKCKESEKKGFTVCNHLEAKEIVEPEKENRKKEGLLIVSPRNCETVEPEIIPPYGGGMLPSGSHQGATSQQSEEDKSAEFY